MSEEILRALMELFALIVKQDGGMLRNERNYVVSFLNKQISHEATEQYLELFDSLAGPVTKSKIVDNSVSPSVTDSVKILAICKTINRILNQTQKVVVLMRLFELVNSDRQFTVQRMNIINTVAEVFRIRLEEFSSIEQFIREEVPDKLINPLILVIDDKPLPCHRCSRTVTGFKDTIIAILRIPSADIYFIKYLSDDLLYLNGLPVVPGYFYTFASGSSLKSGQGKSLYYTDIVSKFLEDTTTQRLSLEADHISYRFPDGNLAFRDLSFTATEGNLVGILGASGSGKTTLINLLAGILRPTSGIITINGSNIHERDSGLEGIIGLVPQDDMLMENLTVFENLYYAAALSFSNKSREEISELVDKTLNSLGLLEIKNFKVGSTLNKIISGGQRKRLNIALELIREPSVLFLDEPTSGLASKDSENVMDLLRELSLKGKILVTVIHQPSSDIFKMFDLVLIMDQGGFMTYFGNPVEAVIHFKTLDAQINSSVAECPSCGNVNPETIFRIMEAHVVDEFGRYTKKRKVSPEEWNRTFSSTVEHKKEAVSYEKPKAAVHKPGRFRQMILFMQRDLKNKVSDKQYMLLTLLEAPILGFILSFIIRYIADPSSDIYLFAENENIPIFIFMSIIVALFLGLIVSAEEIFRDRIVLRREVFLDLSRNSYLLSKVIVMALISAIQTGLFILVANNILSIKGLYLNYFIVLFATAFCANMIGLNISASLKSAISIYIVIPLLMVPMMVLSGAMFPFDKLNRKISSVDKVPFIAEIIPTRWTYEALIVTQFKDNRLFRLPFTREGATLYAIEKEIWQANYNQVYKINALRDALAKTLAEYHILHPAPRADNRNDEQSKDLTFTRLTLLRNELLKMISYDGMPAFRYTDMLRPEEFSPAIADSLSIYLDIMASEYASVANNAERRREMFRELNTSLIKAYENDYRNIQLEEMVKKDFEKNKILIYKDRLIQNVYPIYQDPVPAGFSGFRTHFLSPSKYLFGRRIDTCIFNVCLVFFSTIILYILLYYEAGAKIAERLARLKVQKKMNDV